MTSLVVPTSERKREKMMHFLEMEFKSADEIFPSRSEVYLVSLVPTTEFDYKEPKGVVGIGFNGATDQIEEYYTYRIAQWIAVMIGEKRNDRHYLYRLDGVSDVCYRFLCMEENIPAMSKNSEYIKIDENGFNEVGYHRMYGVTEEEFDDITKAIKDEIKQLTEKWNEYNT